MFADGRGRFVTILALIIAVFGALFVILPRDLVFALSVTALVAFLYFGIVAGLTRYAHRVPD